MIRSIAKALLSLAVRRWPRLEGVAIGLLLRWHAEQPARDAAQLEADEQLEARLLAMRTDVIDLSSDDDIIEPTTRTMLAPPIDMIEIRVSLLNNCGGVTKR
jgi:hypothetical protein